MVGALTWPVRCPLPVDAATRSVTLPAVLKVRVMLQQRLPLDIVEWLEAL